jgi:hypothetical protein
LPVAGGPRASVPGAAALCSFFAVSTHLHMVLNHFGSAPREYARTRKAIEPSGILPNRAGGIGCVVEGCVSMLHGLGG